MSNHPAKNEGMQIWFCRDCNQIHLRATNVTLDFTRQEFLSLSNAILGILRNEFSPEDLQSLTNFAAETDDILFAETVV
jgi:Zn-finger protein